MRWLDKGLALRLTAGLGVAAVVYVGRVCSWFAGLLVLYVVVEGAWGVAGAFGVASSAGSIACGIGTSVFLKRDAGRIGRLVFSAVGAIVLMLLGAVLVGLQVR